jgi:hypothetical protein
MGLHSYNVNHPDNGMEWNKISVKLKQVSYHSFLEYGFPLHESRAVTT